MGRPWEKPGIPLRRGGAGEVQVSPRVPACPCTCASPCASLCAMGPTDTPQPRGWEWARSCVGQIILVLGSAPLHQPQCAGVDTGCPGDGGLAAGITGGAMVAGLD